MIISDLVYLEVVPETLSIVGGGKRGLVDIGVANDIDVGVKVGTKPVTVITQVAVATAVGVSVGGKVYVDAKASNGVH